MSNAIGGGSFLNIVEDVASVALAPETGGTSLELVATNVFKQEASNIFSSVLQDLPLSQGTRDAAQLAFSTGVGDYQSVPRELSNVVRDAGNHDASGSYTGNLDSAERTMAENWSNFITQMGLQKHENDAKHGKMGWLEAMAKALGRLVDQAAQDMENKANAVNKDDPSTSTDFQVASQLFGIIMNATTTAIKSAGDGLTTAARKN